MDTPTPVRWRELFPEAESRYERFAFPAQAAEVQRALWDTRPDQFKPSDAEPDVPFPYGATLELPLLEEG